MPAASRAAAERARKRKRGKHKPPGYRKKTARAVRRGKQQTLAQRTKERQPLPRLLTPGEAEYLYNQALAEIWGVPMERIRTRSWVLPEITYFN